MNISQTVIKILYLNAWCNNMIQTCLETETSSTSTFLQAALPLFKKEIHFEIFNKEICNQISPFNYFIMLWIVTAYMHNYVLGLGLGLSLTPTQSLAHNYEAFKTKRLMAVYKLKNKVKI